MAHTIPTVEPNEITAGDLVTWKKSLADYPAGAGWVLSYALTTSAAHISITGTADNDDHLISVAAATTAAYTAGEYSIQGYVTNGLERYRVYKGDITIRPDRAQATSGLDNRTHARKMLDLIEAALEALAAGTMRSTSILGTTYTRKDEAQLSALRDRYLTEYRAEQNAERLKAGKKPRGRILSRFV